MRVQLAGMNVLSLAEVQVMGQAAGGGGTDIEWLVSDQLGTPRMVLDQTGSLSGVKRHDYLPFGEELFAGTGVRTTGQGYVVDVNRQQFAGYERDNETLLDYAKARYFSNALGRFISPDPLLASSQAIIPQSWNRYSYVLNNPLKFTDPSGKIWVYTFLDRGHHKARYSWFDGDERDIESRLGKGYHPVQFGKSGTVTIALLDGRLATLKANSPLAEIRSPAPLAKDTNGEVPREGLKVMHEVAKRPFEKVTGGFVLVGAGAGAGVAIAAPGVVASTTVTGLGIDSLAVTTSGAASDVAVIGSLENAAQFIGQEGYNVLQESAGYTFSGVNLPWLNSIIQNGQTVLVTAGGVGTQMEIDYLQKVGGYIMEGNKLVPPH